MNDLWRRGLAHFQRGNYHAAHELWQQVYATTDDPLKRARAANSIGAVTSLLHGNKVSLPYFELADSLCRRTNPDDPMRIKYLTNAALVLSRVDHLDSALQLARQALELVPPEIPVELLDGLNVVLLIMVRNELYQAAAELAQQYIQCLAAAGPDKYPVAEVARLHHYLGYALQELGRPEEAEQHFHTALSIREMPGTLQELSRIYLFSARERESALYLWKLHDLMFTNLVELHKLELADTLAAIATHAYYAGHEPLFRQSAEKAELYYGQLLRWKHWLAMQNLESTLRSRPVNVKAAATDWSIWYSFVDDLTLMDGIEAMFPKLFRLSEIATNLAIRLARRLAPDPQRAWRMLRVAGRFVYLGLTALASTETDAVRVLGDSAGREDVCELGARLLEPYPHTAEYRNLLRYHRSVCPSSVEAEQRLLSQCLGIAVHYTEAVELAGFTHEQAVRQTVDAAAGRWDESVVVEFRSEVQVLE